MFRPRLPMLRKGVPTACLSFLSRGAWFAALGLFACSGSNVSPPDAAATVDAAVVDGGMSATIPTSDHPTARTAALYAYLARQVGRPSALFGQQHASWEGNGIQYNAFESDVRRALAPVKGTGARHPALFGWNFDTWYRGSATLRAALRQRIIDTDAQGGINTLHWPMGNFAKDCGSPCGDNDNTDGLDPVALVATNMPIYDGRNAGVVFDGLVDALAAFLADLRSADGEPIPIVLRPFHEMNRETPGLTAHWWTGRNPDHYRAMFQRMVDRLRVTHGLRNVIVAFAPSAKPLFTGTDTPANLYARYWPETVPATAAQRYVDIAAFDHYFLDDEEAVTLFNAIDTTFAFATASARVVPRVTAVAETGRKDGTGSPCTGGPVCYQNGAFWTSRVLPGMDANGSAAWSRIAYMLTWTNGTFSTYPGAPATQASDFVAWFDSPATLFLGEGDTF